MKKNHRLLSLLLVSALFLALSACGGATPPASPSTSPAENNVPSAPSSPQTVRIACGPVGGYQNTMYNTIANLINQTYPGYYNFAIEASTGSAENARLLALGEVDFGTMGLDVSKAAYEASEKYEGLPAGQIATVYTHPGMGAAVHIIAHPKSDIETIEDLKGKKMATTAGIMQTYLEDTLFAHDMTLDDLGHFTNLSLKDMMTALQEGTIDAFCYGNTAPNVNFTDLATTFGFKLIDVETDHIEKLIESKPWYYQVDLPAGTYSCQENDVHTFAQDTVFCCSVDVPEETVYNILKTIMENTDYLTNVNRNMNGFTPEGACRSSIIPFHPGAVKYFAEQGITVE